MPYPIFDEFVTEVQGVAQAVSDQFDAASVSLTEWLSKQHKADGSHGAVTADSLVVSGNITISGSATMEDLSIRSILTKQIVVQDFAVIGLFVGGFASQGEIRLTTNNTFIRGDTVASAVKSLIGVNASDKVSIDADALGVVMAGTLGVTGMTTLTAQTNAIAAKLTGRASDNLADVNFYNSNGATLNALIESGDATNALSLWAITNTGIAFYTNSTLHSVVSNAGAWRWHAYGAGALTTDGSGNITAVSDERVKSDVRPFMRGLEAVLGLAPKIYKRLADDTHSDECGFIAQDVQRVIPETVGRQGDGMLTLADRGILGAIVNAIQELNRKIERG